MAQSRPKRNRRPLAVRNQYQPQLFVPDPAISVSRVGAQLVLETSIEPGLFGPLEDVEWPLATDSVEYLSDTAYLNTGGDLLTIKWTVPPGIGSCDASIPAWSPAFRTRVGGYLAPTAFNFLNLL